MRKNKTDKNIESINQEELNEKDSVVVDEKENIENEMSTPVNKEEDSVVNQNQSVLPPINITIPRQQN